MRIAGAAHADIAIFSRTIAASCTAFASINSFTFNIRTVNAYHEITIVMIVCLGIVKRGRISLFNIIKCCAVMIVAIYHGTIAIRGATGRGFAEAADAVAAGFLRF